MAQHRGKWQRAINPNDIHGIQVRGSPLITLTTTERNATPATDGGTEFIKHLYRSFCHFISACPWGNLLDMTMPELPGSFGQA